MQAQLCTFYHVQCMFICLNVQQICYATKKKHTICRFLLHSVNKNYTSTTFCCLNQRRLEKCRWPGSGYETVGVPNHRKHHGWSRMYIDKFLFFCFSSFFTLGLLVLTSFLILFHKMFISAIFLKYKPF